jgi:hypothetical protein
MKILAAIILFGVTMFLFSLFAAFIKTVRYWNRHTKKQKPC